MAAGLHISISAEKVFELSGVPISNSILTTWVVSGLLILLAIKTYLSFTKASFTGKPNRFQSLMELIIESLFNLVKSVAGSDKKARIFFPLIATFFIFILFSNWAGLIPGVGSIGFKEAETAIVKEIKPEQSGDEIIIVQEQAGAGEVIKTEEVFVPYFRGPTADLNTTLALAVFAMVSVQIAGFKFLGFHYPAKFFNLKGPMDFFVGILELSSEFSKIISFAFRLFGNIFAGEVLLTVMAFLMPFFGPIPFIGLEIFVGLVQALVFSMLCLVFMNLATIGHSEEHA